MSKVIAIYQLPVKDEHAFRGFDEWDEFHMDNYTCVYVGVRDDDYDVEDAWVEFNVNHPDNYEGHSLSVSDVVDIGDKSFYCDEIGWKELFVLD